MSAETQSSNAETYAYQTEVSKLLNIVTNALYSEKEIFLRELISNAADACDKRRYLAQSNDALGAQDESYGIEVIADKKAGRLTIKDNGVGMSRQELIDNLGTIAKSGTSAFLEQLASQKDQSNPALIGQFGVGFYASFMVADQVDVTSRKAGEDSGYRWQSDGSDGFTLEAIEGDVPVGTEIILTLKEDQREYAEHFRLRHIIKTHSDHIAFPITLSGVATATDDGESDEPEDAPQSEVVNKASALWTLPKSDISEDDYRNFYRDEAGAFDEPLDWMHFSVEGMVSYSGILFLPTQPPMDLFDPQRRSGLKLYCNRVLIDASNSDLLPPYLRFVRGVIDSPDVSLNVSRELLQNEEQLQKIKSGLTKRILRFLAQMAEKEPEKYATFWESFGPVLKEGLYEDPSNREALLELVRFEHCGEGDKVSLSDYVENFAQGQSEIYYLAGKPEQKLSDSPHLEGFKSRGINVLLMPDPVDSFWVTMAPNYKEHTLRTITAGDIDLTPIGETKSPDKDQAKDPAKKDEGSDDATIAALIVALKADLDDQVADVRKSNRLTDSPACLIAESSGPDLGLQAILAQQGGNPPPAKSVLEINPDHPLIAKLATAQKDAEHRVWVKEVAQALVDISTLQNGENLSEPANFARNIANLLSKS